MCLPYEDNKNETYTDKNLILSGWGFTTIGKEERNTGNNCTSLDFYWTSSMIIKRSKYSRLMVHLFLLFQLEDTQCKS